MKLNLKNVRVYKQGLYARQLLEYSKLCKMYARLANIYRNNYGDNPYIVNDIERRYKEPLSRAAEGDLSFIDPVNNYVSKEDYFGPYYDEREVQVFQDYAETSKTLNAFKNALQQLSKQDLSEKDIQKYTASLTRNDSKSLADYHHFATNGSSRFVGHRNFLLTQKSLFTIEDIDKNLIAIPKFSESATPANFGSKLSSHPTTLADLERRSKGMYSKSEAIKYDKSIPTSVVLADNSVRAANSIKRFVGKKSVRKTIAAGALALALTLSGQSLARDYKVHTLSIDNPNYTQTVSNETIDLIRSIESDLNRYMNSNTPPTEEELREMRTSLDDVIDVVFSDLITKGFESHSPDCKVLEVESRYQNYNGTNQSTYFTITYLGPDGQTHQKRVSDFTEFLRFSTPISDSFDDEYYLDSNKLEREITAAINSNNDFQTKSDNSMTLLEKYNDILESIKQLAGCGIEYDENLFGNRLEIVVPPEAPKKATPQTETGPTQNSNDFEIEP